MSSMSTKWPTFGEWQARRGITPWTFKMSISDCRKSFQKVAVSIDRVTKSFEKLKEQLNG